jgi:hypothetical protein
MRKNCTALKTTSRILSDFSEKKGVAEEPMYHNCTSLCSLCKRKEEAKKYITPVFINFRN